MARWDLERKAGRMSVRGRTLGGETLLSPAEGKEDKSAMRQFYKTVRSKPKERRTKGRRLSCVEFRMRLDNIWIVGIGLRICRI